MTRPIHLPVKIIATPSGYKIRDAQGRTVCYVYETRGTADPTGYTRTDALEVAQRIARLLSGRDPAAPPDPSDTHR